jgi:hypothetical protein
MYAFSFTDVAEQESSYHFASCFVLWNNETLFSRRRLGVEAFFQPRRRGRQDLFASGVASRALGVD